MLTNPTLSTLKRKDSIALKFDNEERSIKAVWITGSQETYPVLTDSSSIKYLLLANVELLPGGSVKSVTDKRKYCQALYTMSLEEFQNQFSLFISSRSISEMLCMKRSLVRFVTSSHFCINIPRYFCLFSGVESILASKASA